MARKRKERSGDNVGDYRHDEIKLKKNPLTGIIPPHEALPLLSSS